MLSANAHKLVEHIRVFWLCIYIFTTASENSSLIDGNLTHSSTVKELFLRFVQLNDRKSNIGFQFSSTLFGDTDKELVISGVLSATGKILKIEAEGANVDALVGKHWDELSSLIMK